MVPSSTAVIGAGIAGLAAARALAAHGPVTVFDKGRGHGGRLAHRRTEHAQFDHGAQYLTAHDAGFRAIVDGWCTAGVAAPWTGRLVTLGAEGVRAAPAGARFVGVPGMSAVVRHLAGDLAVHHGVQVASLEQVAGGWRVRDAAGGDRGTFAAVVIAAPAPQAAALLPVPALAARARAAVMTPCWAAMATFAAPVDVPYDGARIEDDPLGWIARETSKPGRGPAEAWTLHATPAWSTAHLEAERAEVAAALVAAFRARTGAPAAVTTDAHRWRYALVATPVGEPCLVDRAAGIAACGDWCLGPRIELAYASGLAAAAALAG